MGDASNRSERPVRRARGRLHAPRGRPDQRPLDELHELLAVRKAWSEIFHQLGPALAPLTAKSKPKPKRNRR
jgi:hypothetical protein